MLGQPDEELRSILAQQHRELYDGGGNHAGSDLAPMELRVDFRQPCGGAALLRELGNMAPSKSSLDRLPKALSARWEASRGVRIADRWGDGGKTEPSPASGIDTLSLARARAEEGLEDDAQCRARHRAGRMQVVTVADGAHDWRIRRARSRSHRGVDFFQQLKSWQLACRWRGEGAPNSNNLPTPTGSRR